MELYKRNVGYQDIGRTSNLVVTATTIYLPVFLTQSFEDMGIFTDMENPIIEVVTGFTGLWDTTSNSGNNQKPCLTLNNCGVLNTTIITPSYYGGNNGSISLTIDSNCPSPSTFVWSGPDGYTNNTNLNINGLKAGNYVLKITDNNCDVSYHNFLLTQPQYLSNSITQTNSQINDVNGTCDGSAVVNPTGGVPPYNFNWFINTNPTGTTWVSLGFTTSGITNLCAGGYLVQVTDSSPSPTTVSSMFTITEPSALSGSTITTVDINCNGGNTGYIEVKGVGGVLGTGYTYNLSPGGITNYTGIFKDLYANSYTVTITDSVLTTYNLTPIILTQPIVLTPTLTVSTNAGCYGDNLGSLYLNVNGGISPYNIELYLNGSLSNTISDPLPTTITDLFAGEYYIKVTDVNGCGPVTTVPVTIYHRDEFLVSVSKPTQTNGYDIPCYSGITQITATTIFNTLDAYTSQTPAGNIDFYANGVYKGSCYHNIGSGCVKVLTGLTADNYTITSVSNVGCSADTFVSLTQPPMSLSVTSGLITVEDNACQTTTASVPGGLSPQSVNFTYGCSDTPGGCRQAVIDINGGIAPYTITWSDGGVANGTVSAPHCVGYGNITATVTDSNGCVVVKTITI